MQEDLLKKHQKQQVKVGDRFKNNWQGCWCTVVRYVSSRRVEVIFDENPEKSQWFTAHNLIRGSFRDPYHRHIHGVGCFGEGEFKAIDPNGSKVTYSKWLNGITRCYCPESLKEKPKYEGCTVSEDWLCYQNFAKWHTTHKFYGLGYELDKDLLVRGNKVYSAETCCLLPQELNKLVLCGEYNQREYPAGVSLHHDKKSFIASMSANKGRKYIGIYKTPEEASAAYVEAKEKYVKYVAEKWHGKIEERAYQALKSWTVYPK